MTHYNYLVTLFDAEGKQVGEPVIVDYLLVDSFSEAIDAAYSLLRTSFPVDSIEKVTVEIQHNECQSELRV